MPRRAADAARLQPSKTDMARIVQKFGGTSIAGPDRIEAVARFVKREVEDGHEVAVVVSAMAGVTNELVELASRASPLHDVREYDTVLASGEQVSAGLLALSLQCMGVSARSWLGWQVPIRSDNAHGKARIESIETAELERRLADGQVPVVTGFQALGPDNRITTLGRGGSDTTAVALAAALGGGPVRHLHRCRRNLHRRPAHRDEGTQAR